MTTRYPDSHRTASTIKVNVYATAHFRVEESHRRNVGLNLAPKSITKSQNPQERAGSGGCGSGEGE